jgi:hypothetical protein
MLIKWSPSYTIDNISNEAKVLIPFPKRGKEKYIQSYNFYNWTKQNAVPGIQ